MSSPQSPDGGQQEQPQAAENQQDNANAQADQNTQAEQNAQADQGNQADQSDQAGGDQTGSEATQVVRPAQLQQSAEDSNATQVVKPLSQQPQPMYQQPGLANQGGGEATTVVPPLSQQPQPMYQQPGTQSQPGGFPAQPPNTPSGGFPAPPQGQPAPGYGQPGYGQQGAEQGNKVLAMIAAIAGIVTGLLGIFFGFLGIAGLAALSSMSSAAQVITAIGRLAGGVILLLRKPIGPMVLGIAAALTVLLELIIIFRYPLSATVWFDLIFGIALAVLAFLPATRQWAAASPAPAGGGFAQPQPGFPQPGQQAPQPGGFAQPPPHHFGADRDFPGGGHLHGEPEA
ncbi:DUF4064 domain-containing protein, partial [Saccharopolyspora rectivirgula]|uniref:DUF4064 domain-containing protein n=1 Tax=Saccharopolyspora rectivirgula TaxID=28042 RepID=UPI000683F90E